MIRHFFIFNRIITLIYKEYCHIIPQALCQLKAPQGGKKKPFRESTRIRIYGHRDYDPDIGRWTAKDPILFEGGDTDLYGYCLNDPVNNTDPEGEFILPAVGAVVCLAAIVAGYINWFYWATHPPIPEEEPVIKPPSACPVEHPGMGKEPKIAVNPKTKVYPGPPKPRMPRPGIIRR